MADIDDIIPVTIFENAGPAQLASFDFLAVMTEDTPNASFGVSNRAKRYPVTQTGRSLVSTDFGPSSDTVKAFEDALNQEQKPEYIYILKRDAAVAQQNTLTFSGNVLAGQTIVGSVNGVAISVPFDTDMAGTLADLVDAIEDVTGIASATVNTLVVTVVATAEYQLNIGAFTVTGSGTLPTVTKAVTVAGRLITDDIAAALAEKSTAIWFALCPLTVNKGALMAAASYMQGLRRQLYIQSDEAGIKTTGSVDDVAYLINSLELTNTTGVYHADTSEYAHVAAASLILGNSPGSIQLENRNLVGITPDDLTADEVAQIESRNFNHFQEFAGSGRVRPGGRSGDGKPSESVRSKYYWANEIQETAWSYLGNTKKPPRNIIGRLALQTRLQETNNRMVDETVLNQPDSDDPLTSNEVTVVEGSTPGRPIARVRGQILNGMGTAEIQIYAEVS